MSANLKEDILKAVRDSAIMKRNVYKECAEGRRPLVYENIVITVSNYATDGLQDTLTKYGQSGFKLVNVTMTKNKYGVDVMYLFFTRKLRK